MEPRCRRSELVWLDYIIFRSRGSYKLFLLLFLFRPLAAPSSCRAGPVCTKKIRVVVVVLARPGRYSRGGGEGWKNVFLEYMTCWGRRWWAGSY